MLGFVVRVVRYSLRPILDLRESRILIARHASMHAKRPAFTLIEVLIVVAILAILAASAVPQFENSSTDATDAALMKSLRILRHQIGLYKAQHNGKPPGYPNQVGLVYPQFLMYSSSAGSISNFKSNQYEFGPYVNTLPKNPFNDAFGFKDSSDPASESADESLQYMGNTVGWFYNPEDGTIAANAEGTTSLGIPRTQL